MHPKIIYPCEATNYFCKKSRIRETPTLSTDVDSRTDTNLKRKLLIFFFFIPSRCRRRRRRQGAIGQNIFFPNWFFFRDTFPYRPIVVLHCPAVKWKGNFMSVHKHPSWPTASPKFPYLQYSSCAPVPAVPYSLVPPAVVAGVCQAAGAARAARPHPQRLIMAWHDLNCPTRGSGGTGSLRGPSAYILYQNGSKSPPWTPLFRAVVLQPSGDSQWGSGIPGLVHVVTFVLSYVVSFVLS